MSLPATEHARAIYASVLEALRPDRIVGRSCALRGSTLTVGGRSLDLDSFDNVYVCGAGKASCGLAQALLKIIHPWVKGGLIITKTGHSEVVPPLTVLESSHPIPDESSLRAGDAMLEFAHSCTDKDLVLFILSGGASSLMESLREKVSLQMLQTKTSELLRGGASISEINEVRSEVSNIKAGGLSRAFGQTTVICLVLSDVLTNDLNIVGSAPLYSGAHGIPHIIVGDLSLALQAAEIAAVQAGLQTTVASQPIAGEAQAEAKHLVAAAEAWFSQAAPDACYIAGGEPVVTLSGWGKGGRCQEFACAAAAEISGNKSLALLAGSTDGTDGPTDVAAGIVDGGSASRAESAGITVQSALESNASHDFLAACDGLILTGPTQCNVNDVYIVVRS